MILVNYGRQKMQTEAQKRATQKYQEKVNSIRIQGLCWCGQPLAVKKNGNFYKKCLVHIKEAKKYYTSKKKVKLMEDNKTKEKIEIMPIIITNLNKYTTKIIDKNINKQYGEIISLFHYIDKTKIAEISRYIKDKKEAVRKRYSN
jgi:hypothetical protein